jgi:protein translocase SecG subunit
MTVESALMFGALVDVVVVLLWIALFLSAVLLIFVVLIQEGKGGGLAAALGGAGTEAFGVKAGGINKFTAIVAAIFLLSAILLAAIRPTTVTRGGGDGEAGEKQDSRARVEAEACREA